MYQRLLLRESDNQALEVAIAKSSLQEISDFMRRHGERLAISATSLHWLRVTKNIRHTLFCSLRQFIAGKWLRPEPVHDLFLSLPDLLYSRHSQTSHVIAFSPTPGHDYTTMV